MTVPSILTRLRNWLRWSLKQNERGKATKAPDQSTRDKTKLRSFADVKRAGPIDAGQGIGFCWPGSPVRVDGGYLFAIDLDACRDPIGGAVEPWAEAIVEALQRSYTEITPSGCGLRIWFVVAKPPTTLRRAKVKVNAPPAPNVPETKSVEFQVFGYGAAQYVTVTGNRRIGTGPEFAVIEDLSVLENIGVEVSDKEPTQDLPVGTGAVRTLDDVQQRVKQLGPKLANAVLLADWRPILTEADDRDVSASAAFYRVCQHVLRACGRHGRTALDFIASRTAWGAGNVEESADPSKYARRSWVAAELARVAEKAPAVSGDGFDDDFDAENWKPPAVANSPIALAAALPARNWFADTPPLRRYLLRHPDGDGLLPLGKAATLTAAGGVGKTTIVVQLAVSIATGRNWLGYFGVDALAPRRVLLLLGEEDAEEVHRKIHAAGLALGLTPAEQAAAVENVVPLALAGKVVPLLRVTNGDATETEHFEAALEVLNTRGPWGLVVIDPQSRFAGCDVETDNSLATRFVQTCEKLTDAPGGPTVLDLAHSSKIARRMGGADSRGVTGLTDGFRWHATLRAAKKGEAGDVVLEVQKNNLGKPSGQLALLRGAGGLLFAESPDDRRARAEQDAAAERETVAATEAVLSDRMGKVLAAARERPGLGKNELAAAIGGNRPAAKEAIETAVARGLLENRRQGQAHRYFPAPATGAQ